MSDPLQILLTKFCAAICAVVGVDTRILGRFDRNFDSRLGYLTLCGQQLTASLF